MGGGHYGPPYHESVCRCRMVRATLTKLPDFVPFHICQVPESQFWCLFFKKLKKFDVENFWGSLGENGKILNFLVFLLINLTFSSSIWIVHVLSFHLRCITPLKLKILKILNFSTIISIENCRPLVTKLRDLKMFKMAFQVVFSTKNVPRFSFGLLVAPKPKKQGGP